MAEIRSLGFVRHLRAEPSSHVIRYRRGEPVARGRGLSFWFLPMSAGVAEVPVDDRELTFLFHGRAADFQDVSIQGTVMCRITDPEALSDRIDFSIDLKTGRHLEQPLSKIAAIVTQLAQQLTWTYVATSTLRDVLQQGYDRIRTNLEGGLMNDGALSDMGIEVVAVRIASVQPTADLQKALEAPTREGIQQRADEAAFARRAQAVQNERAIQENELKNRIELARQEEQLIAQHGQNTRRQVSEEAEAKRLGLEAEEARRALAARGAATRSQVSADANAYETETGGRAEAARTALVEAAQNEALATRMSIYRDVSPAVLLGLAAQQLAQKLDHIEHLNITPHMLGTMLDDLVRVGTQRLTVGSEGDPEGAV